MNIKCAKHKKINTVCMVHYYLTNHTRFISTFSIKNRGVTSMLQSILLHMPVVVQLENSSPFREPKGSLLCLQQPTGGHFTFGY